MNLFIFFVLFFISNVIFCFVFADERKVYIAYMGSLPTSEYSPLAHHQTILEEILENSLLSDSLVYNYKRSFNGFAALLTEKEKEKLKGIKSIVSVFPSKKYQLHTTRSWDFMGLKNTVHRSKAESNIIVGLIDSGIWPEAESFSDENFSSPPRKWKGACDGGENFTCNNKVIGARYYSNFPPVFSARDSDGHGTHTASTAAGNQVNQVSFYGLAKGDVRGAVPSARIAVYNACGDLGCATEDILAAFDDAISDGVDILSISIGHSPEPFHHDPIAIGSFHAMKKGILTSHSAGNNGPKEGTVASVAPWLLTVAASTIDRDFFSKVVLGDNTTLVGRAINSFDMNKRFPLVDGGQGHSSISASSYCNKSNPRLCDDNRFDNETYEGKIVFYHGVDSGDEALSEKAAGMITESANSHNISWVVPLPASHLNITDGKKVESYMKNTKNPVASILKSVVVEDPNAPMVAYFSSRGPNPITPDILKPDITAPGVNILAAWPPEVPLTSANEDERSVKYNFLSGTSMSCPHATGAAAYMKSFHPHWSPSAIKSALMTTAFPLNSIGSQDSEFGYGAGHIDPVKAVHPGLVYDAGEGDYIKFLCSIGYTAPQLKLLTGRETSCPKDFKGSPKDLNYPSFVVDAEEAKFTRTVTNVGLANSTYRATIISPPNWKITVTPDVLAFKSLNEKQTFLVTVSAARFGEKQIQSASLLWSDGAHKVRSPIVLNRKIVRT